MAPNEYNIQYGIIQAMQDYMNQSDDKILQSNKSIKENYFIGQTLFMGNEENAEWFMINPIVNLALRSQNHIEKISELTRALDYCHRLTRRGLRFQKHIVLKQIGKYFGDQGHFQAQLDYIKEAIQILKLSFDFIPFAETIEANLIFWLCDSYLNLNKPIELIEFSFEFCEKNRIIKQLNNDKRMIIDWYEVYIVYVMLEIYEEIKKQCEKLISYCQEISISTFNLNQIEELLANLVKMNEIVFELKSHIKSIHNSFITNKNKYTYIAII